MIQFQKLPRSASAFSTLTALSALTALSVLCGCAASSRAPGSSDDAATGISGHVHGGQQPVANATVTLFAPGLTGYGSNPTALVSTTSDANGDFTLPRPYTCPTQNDVLTYVVAKGGNPGAGINPLLTEVALLGPCSSLSSGTVISISEVTTVAAAYTLAPFASVAGVGGGGAVNVAPNALTASIGTSATNVLGLANTLGPANNLVNTGTGFARGVNEVADMTLPTAEMNTLADILAACVNTNGVLSTGPAVAPCGTLITEATPPGGTPPADTFMAALDIALNPGNNAPALYSLSSSSAPFQPTLTIVPGDFALGIQYTGGLIAASGFTSGLAIDSQGNAWVGNGLGNGNAKSVSKISPAGLFLSGANGFANGIAGGNGYSIDGSDNVFIAVANLNEVIKMNNSGTIVSTVTSPSFQKPLGVAIDNRNGSIWTTNANNTPSMNNGINDFVGTTISRVGITGIDLPGSPFGGQNGPDGVQIDALDNVWVANSGNNTTLPGTSYLSKFTPSSGAMYTEQIFNTGNNSFPFDLAIDNGNNVWVPLVSTVAKYSNSGVLLSGSGYSSASTNFPNEVIIDGLNRAFVSNQTDINGIGPGALSVFSNTGTLLSTSNGNKGYLANNTINNLPFIPCGIAIDPSGDVWITGITTNANGIGYVTELVGIAAPVKTPNPVASSTNQIGVRP